MFTGSPNQVAIDGSLTRIFGISSFFRTLSVLLLMVTFYFLGSLKNLADWLRITSPVDMTCVKEVQNRGYH